MGRYADHNTSDKPIANLLKVVQEVALAPNSICFYGDCQLWLLDVLRAGRWLDMNDTWTGAKSSEESSKLQERLGTMWAFIDVEYGPGSAKGLKFLQIWERTRSLWKTEPRASMFAILGLYNHVRQSTSLLWPDYQKPLPEVIRDAMKHVLRESKGGDIFKLFNGILSPVSSSFRKASSLLGSL
jgi:hypothetical protein